MLTCLAPLLLSPATTVEGDTFQGSCQAFLAGELPAGWVSVREQRNDSESAITVFTPKCINTFLCILAVAAQNDPDIREVAVSCIAVARQRATDFVKIVQFDPLLSFSSFLLAALIDVGRDIVRSACQRVNVTWRHCTTAWRANWRWCLRGSARCLLR
jgi:hypothetical protein